MPCALSMIPRGCARSPASEHALLSTAVLRRPQAEDLTIAAGIARARHAGIKRTRLHRDNVVANEAGAIAGAVLGMFKATFPFQRGPAAVVILGEFGEDQAEVDIAVAWRAKPAGALQPVDVSRVDPRLGASIPFGILDVKGHDALVVDVKESTVVDMLQEEVRGIIEDTRCRVLPMTPRKRSKDTPSCRSSPGCSSKPTRAPAASKASSMGRQRCASSAKPSSTSPLGRGG